jgi:hypothetical protein
LAIVYQIVQAHDGKVWVRSKMGQGCTFILRLHRAAEQAAAQTLIQVAAAGATSSAKPVARLIGEGAHA